MILIMEEFNRSSKERLKEFYADLRLKSDLCNIYFYQELLESASLRYKILNCYKNDSVGAIDKDAWEMVLALLKKHYQSGFEYKNQAA